MKAVTKTAITMTKKELIAALSAKEDLLYLLPEPKTIYPDVVEYCRENTYNFDPESLEDQETREWKEEQMEEVNLKNKLFNQYLEEIINLLK